MHLHTFITKMPKYHHQGITEMVLYPECTGGERILDTIPRRDGFGTQVKTDSRAGSTHSQ